MADKKPDLKEFAALDELATLKKANAKLTGELKRSKAKSEDFYEAAREGARDAFLALGRPSTVPAYKPASRKGKAEVALLHLSDWQTGKMNETYNTEVTAARVQQLGEKVLRFTEIERAGHPVHDVHVMLGGDLIEGVSVFPGQGAEVDSALFAQTAAAAGILVSLLRTLAGAFETVVVWEEDGNHGRIGRKGEFPLDNADRLTYYTARLQTRDLEGQGRVQWNERKGWYTIAKIGAYEPLLVHGDEIKSFGGNTPAFGIARKVAAWKAGVIPPFHDVYMGHFHQPLVIPQPQGHLRTFVNCSLESGSTYAQEFVGANGSPGQRLNFVDPVRGRVTSERLVWVD